MNFEGKHLVRWGIPGWTFIIIILSYFFVVDTEKTLALLVEGDFPLLGATALLVGLGIIVGHLIHQLSMLFGFLIWNKWEKYFEDEYELDKIIMKDSLGKEIQRIYSYRLGNIHALRSLTVSCVLSSISLLLLLIFYMHSKYGFYLLIGISIFTILIFINYKYFKANLDYFLKKVKKEKRIKNC